MSRVVSSCTIFLPVTQLLMGKNIYVSPDGSNAGEGSKASPLKSIQAAASKLSAGDTIILRGGRYAESGDKPYRAWCRAEEITDGTISVDDVPRLKEVFECAYNW